jgi:hypothetical protein
VLLIFFYLIITFVPSFLLIFYKYSSKKPQKFFDEVYELLKYRRDGSLYPILVNLLLANDNLLRILENIREWEPEENRNDRYKESYEFINLLLTDGAFLRYLCKRDKFSLLQILRIIKSSGSTQVSNFVRLLSEKLLTENSLLDTEVDYKENESYRDILTNLYLDPFFLTNFNLYDVSYLRDIIPLSSLEKLTMAMELSITLYFQKISYQVPHIFSNPYFSGLEALKSEFKKIIFKIREENPFYGNGYQDLLIRIQIFISGIQTIFENENIQIGVREINLEEGSFMKQFVEVMFELISDVSIFCSNEGQDYARTFCLDLEWLWDGSIKNVELQKNVRDFMFEKMNERIKENLKGGYPPMIRTLLSISGIGTDPLGEGVLKNYKNEILALEGTKVKLLIPYDWEKDENGNYVRDGSIKIKNMSL